VPQRLKFAAVRATNQIWRKSETIMSARQYRAGGQNPIALQAGPTNTARAWLQSDSTLALETQHASSVVTIVCALARKPQATSADFPSCESGAALRANIGQIHEVSVFSRGACARCLLCSRRRQSPPVTMTKNAPPAAAASATCEANRSPAAWATAAAMAVSPITV
jgi:hypothetical protein